MEELVTLPKTELGAYDAVIGVGAHATFCVSRRLGPQYTMSCHALVTGAWRVHCSQQQYQFIAVDV